jgi:hypothetical protein
VFANRIHVEIFKELTSWGQESPLVNGIRSQKFYFNLHWAILREMNGTGGAIPGHE